MDSTGPIAVRKADLQSHPIKETSRLGRILERVSGSAVSFLVHGSLAFLAIFSATGPRAGRGGGIVGGPADSQGMGPRDYSALIDRGASFPVDPRTPEVRAFPLPVQEDTEAPEGVPPAPQDFLQEAAEATKKVPIPAWFDAVARARPRGAYSKLTESEQGGMADAGREEQRAGGPDSQKGNSGVSGTGGDTGGAGDGTENGLFMPAPEYPASARRRNIEGIVVIEVEVHADGHCESPRVTSSSGCVALDQSALEAIGRWTYHARPGGMMETRRIRFVFKLLGR